MGSEMGDDVGDDFREAIDQMESGELPPGVAEASEESMGGDFGDA
jgi:hypothetical protein